MDKLKFLLIEDSPEDVVIIKRQLEKEFQVEIKLAEDESEYKKLLDEFCPDVILSDYFLPHFDGLKALKVRNEICPTVPFILISGAMNHEIELSTIKSGVSDFLIKDDLLRLNFAVKKALEVKKINEEREWAEKKLEESLHRFRSFVENDISGDFIGNYEQIIYCNPRLLEIFGFRSLEELNAFGVKNLYDDISQRNGVWEDLKKGKKIENRELRMHTRDGKPLFILENAFSERDEKGNILQVQGYLIDITPQKEAESSLIDSQSKFRTLMESTAAGIVIYDSEKFLFSNPAMCRLLGYTEEEMLQMNFWDVIHPDHRELVKQRGKARIARNEVPAKYSFKVVTKAGETKWIEFTAGAFQFQGTPAAIGTVYDITALKEAEFEIKKLSVAIEQSPLSVVITDTDGAIEFVNKAFEDETGFTFSEIKGKNPRILQSGKTPPEVYSDMWKTISSGKMWKGEFINRKKDGTEFIELAIISPVIDHLGNIVRYTGVKRDITEEKKMAKQLLEEKAKVEEANRLKTAILTNMSHELRTPLNGILGFSTLIKDAESLEEVKEMTSYINESGQRLLRTLNLIIDVSRLEAGNFTPDFQELEIYSLIDQIVEKYKPDASQKKLSIIFEKQEEKKIVKADVKFLNDIIENLLDNAVKFTNEGNIKIEIHDKTTKNKKYTVIEVSDTGIGISEKNQKLIFHEFQQESYGYGRVYEGIGLGLSLAKKYIELMGGKITVKSKVGEGSTFSVYLPVN